MSVARTFVRLAFSSLIVGALAAACTVKESDDDDKCNAGDSRVCECDDGDTGTQKCNAKETGYSACSCSNGMGGSPNAGGDGPAPTAGTSGSSSGGNGGTSHAGQSAGGDAAGGTDAGGAGGAGPDVTPAVCAEDENDSCANCYQTACCDEWVACTDDEIAGEDNDCAEQFFAITACIDGKRDHDLVPADLTDCAEEVDAKNGAWSSNLRPQVKPMLDCLAGGMGWGAKAAFSSDACKISCFDAL